MSRRWWQDDDTAVLEEAPPARRIVVPPATRPPADARQLVSYREAMHRQAMLLPRGSSRRRAIEKRMVQLTAEILRRELKAG